MKHLVIKLILLAIISTSSAQAQSKHDCYDWRDAAGNIPEPWEDHIATYANGNIRIALLDTVEPAAAAYYLLVMAPPYDEMGNKTCTVIGARGSLGLSGVEFAQHRADYDPSTGLTIRVPIYLYSDESGMADPAILAVTVNQATGDITPKFELP